MELINLLKTIEPYAVGIVFVAVYLAEHVLGINVATVILYGLLLLPVTVLNHSNIRIGNFADRLLRQFVTSPHMHRLHHSVLVKETDSNYGAILPYWDRLFRSYTKPNGKNIKFGL